MSKRDKQRDEPHDEQRQREGEDEYRRLQDGEQELIGLAFEVADLAEEYVKRQFSSDGQKARAHLDAKLKVYGEKKR